MGKSCAGLPLAQYSIMTTWKAGLESRTLSPLYSTLLSPSLPSPAALREAHSHRHPSSHTCWPRGTVGHNRTQQDNISSHEPEFKEYNSPNSQLLGQCSGSEGLTRRGLVLLPLPLSIDHARNSVLPFQRNRCFLTFRASQEQLNILLQPSPHQSHSLR